VNKNKSIRSIENNQVWTVSVGSLMEKKEEYPIEEEKQAKSANLPERTMSGGLWEEWKTAKFIKLNQVWTVLDSGLMEKEEKNTPSKGKRPLARQISQSALSGGLWEKRGDSNGN
jgi:hypothetical protein